MSDAQETFTRFSLSDRIQHVLLIIGFSLLALTGIPQTYSSMDWAKVIVSMFGGIDGMRAIHHISAFITGAICLYHLVSGLYRLFVKQARFEMLPQKKDVTNVVENIAYFLGLRASRPRFDRYTYMEKLVYWVVVWGMCVMGLTGLVMLLPVIAASFFPGDFIPTARAIHGGEALLAITVIVLWHVYDTLLSPRISGMNLSIFTGRMSKSEMMQEHPLEYERETGQVVPEEMLSGRPAQSWSVLAVSAGLSALLVLLLVALIVWAIRPPSPRLPSLLNRPVAHTTLLQPSSMPGQAIEAKPTRVWQANQALRPVADFSAESVGGTARLEGVPPVQFQFANLSTGEVTSWKWDFGDGTTSTDANPQHSYTNCPGTKEMCTVSLIVCGPGGCDTRTKVDHLWVSTKAKK
jgi:formate dehydrogenase subunit gamma